MTTLLHGRGSTAEEILELWEDEAHAVDGPLDAGDGRRKWATVSVAQALAAQANTTQLAEELTEAATSLDLGDEKVLVGYSQGGNVALARAMVRPGNLETVVSIGAWMPTQLIQPARRLAPKLVLVHGKHDNAVPAQEVSKMADKLRAAGYEVDVHLLEAGHALQGDLLETAHAQARPRAVDIRREIRARPWLLGLVLVLVVAAIAATYRLADGGSSG